MHSLHYLPKEYQIVASHHYWVFLLIDQRYWMVDLLWYSQLWDLCVNHWENYLRYDHRGLHWFLWLPCSFYIASKSLDWILDHRSRDHWFFIHAIGWIFHFGQTCHLTHMLDHRHDLCMVRAFLRGVLRYKSEYKTLILLSLLITQNDQENTRILSQAHLFLHVEIQ